MIEFISLPKLDAEQKKFIASILGDVGKLLIATGVIGYFIPGINEQVSQRSFLFSIVFALMFFLGGTALTKQQT